MELFSALEAFASLSQETRLRVFKLVIEYGSTGITPSKIAASLKIPDNTLSFHLSHMAKAGLVSSRREGRSLIYVAKTAVIQDLIGFLKENCCEHEKRKGKQTTVRKC
jgi:ArsR family transcriptional regulator